MPGNEIRSLSLAKRLLYLERTTFLFVHNALSHLVTYPKRMLTLEISKTTRKKLRKKGALVLLELVQFENSMVLEMCYNKPMKIDIKLPSLGILIFAIVSDH